MLGRFFSDLIQYGTRGLANSGQRSVPGVAEPKPPTSVDLGGSIALIDGRHGWFLANRHDLYLGAALIKYGECCEIESRFLNGLISSGDTVVEAGSNIGVHTIPLARALGAAGKLIAIEPQPAVFQVLCANLALNGLTGVRSHMLGVGALNDVMNVVDVASSQDRDHNSGGASLNRLATGIAVKVAPLDDLLRGLGAIDLLKIDVEGMELEVLRGASRTIAADRPLMYVENDRVSKSPALIEWLLNADYHLYWHNPRLFNPDNWFGVAEDIYSNMISTNMLCLPRGREHALSSGLEQVSDCESWPANVMPQPD